MGSLGWLGSGATVGYNHFILFFFYKRATGKETKCRSESGQR